MFNLLFFLIAIGTQDTIPIVVTANGKVTATSVGETKIIAQDIGSQVTDTIKIQVMSPLVSITECATPNPAWIWCDDFEVDRTSQYGMFDTAGGRFGRVAQVGRNGSVGTRGTFDPDLGSNVGVVEVNFGRIPKGPPKMSYVKPVDGGTVDYRQIYWRFFVRTDEDWEGGNGEKLTRATVYANRDRAQAMIAHAWSHNARPHIFLLDPRRGTDEAGNLKTTKWNDFPNLVAGLRAPAASSLMPTHGKWVCVEFMVKLNDAGKSNGEMWYWKNDSLEANFTTYNYLGSYNEYGINAVRLENWWSTAKEGVWGPPINPPKVQSRYFDNFVVSTERIGCTINFP